MNGKTPAPVTEQADVEIKRFTAAEFKVLREKMQKYQEAANVVNEWLSFLKEQYGVNDGEGWQLGEGCFVRPVQPTASTPEPSVAAKPARSRPKRASGAGRAVEDILEPVGVAGENGTGPG